MKQIKSSLDTPVSLARINPRCSTLSPTNVYRRETVQDSGSCPTALKQFLTSAFSQAAAITC